MFSILFFPISLLIANWNKRKVWGTGWYLEIEEWKRRLGWWGDEKEIEGPVKGEFEKGRGEIDKKKRR